jgi:hypothetical protein
VADFYKRMQATASKLLAKFNQGSIEYVQLEQQSGANPWDPVQSNPVVYPVDATATGVDQRYLTDLITQSDIQLNVAVFDVMPNKDGLFKLDGVEKQIIEIQKVPATGTTVSYKIFVKG